MLYKFKSPASSDVIMLQTNAEQLLHIMGKEPGAQGIITVAQIPGAMAALRVEIAREAEQLRARGQAGDDAQDDDEQDAGKKDDGIALHQRAAPLLTLLERSLAEGKDVVWGV